MGPKTARMVISALEEVRCCRRENLDDSETSFPSGLSIVSETSSGNVVSCAAEEWSVSLSDSAPTPVLAPALVPPAPAPPLTQLKLARDLARDPYASEAVRRSLVGKGKRKTGRLVKEEVKEHEDVAWRRLRQQKEVLSLRLSLRGWGWATA